MVRVDWFGNKPDFRLKNKTERVVIIYKCYQLVYRLPFNKRYKKDVAQRGKPFNMLWFIKFTLNVCCGLLVLWGALIDLPALAQEAETDWAQYADLQDEPSAVDGLMEPPQRKLNQASPYEGPPGYNPDKKNMPKPKKKPKQPWWNITRWLSPQADPEPLPVLEELVKVGPREFKASGEPLLRWPRSWRTETGTTLQPGLYLLQTNVPETLSQGVTSGTDALQLNLMRGNQVVLRVALSPVNIAAASQSPVEAIAPKKGETPPPAFRSVRLEWSPNSREPAVRFHYEVGAQRYQSQWLREAAVPEM
jgi:hypothetical protein